jgi:hypothetical protein
VITRWSLASAAALTAAVLMLAACGGSPASPSPSLPTSAAPTASRSPDPFFDSGQKIFITSKGFRPRTLVSVWKMPVVWVNQTGQPQSVVFDHQLVHSGAIPPGGTFSWTSNTVISVTYHSGTMHGAHGAIQVDEPAP